MTRYMLDTNTVSHFIREHPAVVRRQADIVPVEQVKEICRTRIRLFPEERENAAGFFNAVTRKHKRRQKTT